MIELPVVPCFTQLPTQRQTSLGSLVTGLMRDWYGADLAVFNGGNIRGRAKYEQGFHAGDLITELPFSTRLSKRFFWLDLPHRVLVTVKVQIAGHVLPDVLQFSHTNRYPVWCAARLPTFAACLMCGCGAGAASCKSIL